MITVNIDLSEFAELANLGDGIEKAAGEAARDIAAMVHGKAAELAGERLHTRRQMFVDQLSYSRVSDDTWVVTLKADARWIDDGMPEHSLLDQLLASPKAKRAKDGSKYVVVPFDRSPGQGKTSATKPEQDLIKTIQREMKTRGIPFGKIETDQAGQAKLGKLHSFDIMHMPTKTAEAPGQGKGPVGDVRQGPTGIPLLQGVQVYQTKDVKGRPKRSIVTYRIASSKHAGQGRWDHPGLPGANIMEDAAQWAIETFEKEMVPAILSKVSIDLSK